MTAPARIQRSRAKGWRMPENTVYVGRPSYWGNPYECDSQSKDRAYLVRLFRAYLNRHEQSEMRRRIKSELRGKNLACWCPPDAPCHADVLLEIANGAEPC